MTPLPSATRDAATLLLLRDAPRGPQVYMIERHRGNAFMAGAHVFVGGCVDPDDGGAAIAARCRGRPAAESAAILGLADEARAQSLHVAALREAFEESGLLVAVDDEGQPLPSSAKLDEPRRALAAGEMSFATVLQAVGGYLPLQQLRYVAHWITPPCEPRRFDTRFFLCRAPRGQLASGDPRETAGGSWLTLTDALAAQRDERIKLAPPTLCVLEDLAPLRSVDAVLRFADEIPVTTVRPQLLEDAAQMTFVLPGDHRYAQDVSEAVDETTLGSSAEHYVVLRGGRWERVRAG